MYVLVLMLALAPNFEPHYTRTTYLTERDCIAARDKAVDVDGRDGFIVIGKCVPRDRR